MPSSARPRCSAPWAWASCTARTTRKRRWESSPWRLASGTAAGRLANLPSWLSFLQVAPPEPGQSLTIAWWIKVMCALVMAAGTAAGGWRIIKTLGHKMVRLQPVNGFAAETSSAVIIGLASHFGIPVSTTHNVSAVDHGRRRGQAIQRTEVDDRRTHGLGLAADDPGLGNDRLLADAAAQALGYCAISALLLREYPHRTEWDSRTVCIMKAPKLAGSCYPNPTENEKPTARLSCAYTCDMRGITARTLSSVCQSAHLGNCFVEFRSGDQAAIKESRAGFGNRQFQKPFALTVRDDWLIVADFRFFEPGQQVRFDTDVGRACSRSSASATACRKDRRRRRVPRAARFLPKSNRHLHIRGCPQASTDASFRAGRGAVRANGEAKTCR